MSRRRRYRPVRGTGSRIAYLGDRLLVGALDLPGRALTAWRPAPPPLVPAEVREVLVLRLDRMGDVLMTLPALADLRAALPTARIRLAVGAWSTEVARSAPVDELLVWSAPWVGRRDEGALSYGELFARARALRGEGLDLALELSADPRAILLSHLSGARRRAGYANAGLGFLLTDVLPLDETVSWTEESRRAVARVTGVATPPARPDPRTEADRAFARELLRTLGLEGRRPLVGLHPSGGRLVKQWPLDRWAQVIAPLQRELGATVLVTGSAADSALAAQVAALLPEAPIDLTGRLGVRETMAVVGELDLFLSPDTGPMHMACAVDTPSVSVFGPSDPARFFSAQGGPSVRHVVAAAGLWCQPCNLVRKPPAECCGPEGPDCLRAVEVGPVLVAARRILEGRS
jgi:ADP-heptose:LPS heptosyltransferase